MKTISITKFGGIAPRYDSNLKPGMAETAHNCDLSSGKLKPLADNLLVKELDSKHNSLIKYNQFWLYGGNRFFLEWELADADILLYLDNGTAKKRVGNVVANLGHPVPSSPTIVNRTTNLDLSDNKVYEWRESSSNFDLYCVKKNTIDNLYSEPCASLTGWADGDAGVGAASTQAAFPVTGESTFQFDSGNAAPGNLARRTKDIGSIGENKRFGIRLYHTALGTTANDDHFALRISRTAQQLSLRFGTDGMFLYDGAAWNEIAANLVRTGEWQEHVFEWNTDDDTLKVITNNTVVATVADASNTGAFTNGEIVMEQLGSTTANRITNVDWLTIGDLPNPAVTEPSSIKINNELATRADIDEAPLENMEWDWYDKDNLGFQTIYINTTEDYPQSIGNHVWVQSSVATEYYITRRDGAQPDFVTMAGHFVSVVQINGMPYIGGPSSSPGTLTEGHCAVGNNDGLDFSTLYVRLYDDVDPRTTQVNMRIAFAPGAHIVEVKTGGEQDGTQDDEFDILATYNPGEVNGTVYYIICTERDVNGHVDKSGPSAVTDALEVEDATVRITAPTITEEYVTHWYIYRLSNASAEYEFVAKKTIAETYHDDDVADADLGEALDTEYTGDRSGVTITFAPPLANLSGLSSSIYGSMVFAWKGARLTWCEPGKPDAFPSAYSMNFRYPIRNVMVGNKAAIVLCQDGPYLIEGTHPELLRSSDPLGEEPCISPAACMTSRGLVYVSDSGLVLANLAGTTVITDELFGKEWWESNIVGIKTIAEADNKLYVTHDGGNTLVLDASKSPMNWFTVGFKLYAAWQNPADGYLYILDGEGIKKVGAATTFLSPTWKSGKLYGAVPTEKNFHGIILRGSGSVTINVSVDLVAVASKTIDLDTHLERDKTLRLPEQTAGRYCQVEHTSFAGVVDDLILGYSED